MKKIFLLLLIIFFVAGCGGEKFSNGVNNMKHSRIVTVGVDDEFAPMSFRDEQGNLVGFDIDLAKEAARRMGVEFEFKPILWNDKEAEISSGNVDMIWNGLDIIEERKEYMIFSRPYMYNRQILLVRKDNPKNIYSLGDLAGKIVGTQAGSSSETYIDEDEYLKDNFADFKTYDNFKEGFTALSKGELDALIVDEIAARYEMNRTPDTFEAVEVTVGSVTGFGIGFRKNNTELRDKVQKAFDEMIKDGNAKKISEQWFGADLIKGGR